MRISLNELGGGRWEARDDCSGIAGIVCLTERDGHAEAIYRPDGASFSLTLEEVSTLLEGMRGILDGGRP